MIHVVINVGPAKDLERRCVASGLVTCLKLFGQRNYQLTDSGREICEARGGIVEVACWGLNVGALGFRVGCREIEDICFLLSYEIYLIL